MSEKEKATTGSALSALAKLSEAKGPSYVSGLVDGINLGTMTDAKEKRPAEDAPTETAL